MNTLTQTIQDCFVEALQKTLQTQEDIDPILKETTDSKFGDYQINVAMSLAKKLKKSPRDVAANIIQNLSHKNLFEKVEIAGPGFINVFLKKDAVAAKLFQMAKDATLGVAKPKQSLHHVVDFSSPNLAKEMHIGHLRTTLTGEVICRVLEFIGHTVDRTNHVGDWGTQFGMLLQYIEKYHPDVHNDAQNFKISDLESFYKKAKAEFDSDEEFATKARQKVVALQSKEPKAFAIWQVFLKESLRHCHDIYKILDVNLNDKGESFYQDRLAQVVKDMQDKGLAKEDDGAICYFSTQYKNKNGDALPLIIQKSDGGYNYATTDLAAIRHRIDDCKADRVIYVTDIRQAQHFSMVFEAARAMGWVKASTQLDHIGFGMILSKDKKPFKTREGNTVRLKDVISESIERAETILEQSDRGFRADEQKQIAQKIGLAAMKYFDLSHNLASDYIFDWDSMLAMEGNTGPYMLYAYARIKSIGRKANVNFDDVLANDFEFALDHASEIRLAKVLLKFPDVVKQISLDLKPNSLTEYLYNLSKVFHNFYDKKTGVLILDTQEENLKNSRLALCALAARVLKTGLNLLSIDVVDRM